MADRDLATSGFGRLADAQLHDALDRRQSGQAQWLLIAGAVLAPYVDRVLSMPVRVPNRRGPWLPSAKRGCVRY